VTFTLNRYIIARDLEKMQGKAMNAFVIAVVGSIWLWLMWQVIERFFIPFWTDRMADRVVGKIMKTKSDPRCLEDPQYGSVFGDTDCLRIRGRKGDSAELHWRDVEEIHAFKMDLYTTDLICLAFKKSDTNAYYEINEEMAGYHDLLEVLPNRLPKFTMAWVLESPAFDTKEHIIWRRSDKPIAVTDHFKTSHEGSNQNRPLRDA
jgi:hypothetical protein